MEYTAFKNIYLFSLKKQINKANQIYYLTSLMVSAKSHQTNESI